MSESKEELKINTNEGEGSVMTSMKNNGDDGLMTMEGEGSVIIQNEVVTTDKGEETTKNASIHTHTQNCKFVQLYKRTHMYTPYRYE